MSAADASIDGRTLRSVRTRRAVVDAVISLIEEGDIRPTAPRIASRAGVSLRSVYQHFRDLDALFATATDRALEKIGALVRPLPSTGPLDARLAAFVAQRAKVLEALSPLRRAALLQEPFSNHAVAARDRVLALARAEIQVAFDPELRRLDARTAGEVLAALDAAGSWETWEVLRGVQGLSAARARRVLARMLRSVLMAAGEETA